MPLRAEASATSSRAQARSSWERIRQEFMHRQLFKMLFTNELESFS